MNNSGLQRGYEMKLSAVFELFPMPSRYPVLSRTLMFSGHSWFIALPSKWYYLPFLSNSNNHLLSSKSILSRLLWLFVLCWQCSFWSTSSSSVGSWLRRQPLLCEYQQLYPQAHHCVQSWWSWVIAFPGNAYSHFLYRSGTDAVKMMTINPFFLHFWYEVIPMVAKEWLGDTTFFPRCLLSKIRHSYGFFSCRKASDCSLSRSLQTNSCVPMCNSVTKMDYDQGVNCVQRGSNS